jgi:putative N6-adenine-specific DNA methylase
VSEHTFFAIAAPGLEDIVAAELRSFGLDARAERGGAEWTGPLRDAMVANLHSRTASRILVRVAEFNARTFHELERRARKVPWSRFLGGDRAALLRVTCRKSRLFHQGAVAERLFEGMTLATGERSLSAAGSDDPDASEGQLFVVRNFRDRLTISADTSGARLHQRGYRQAPGRAPLRETVAAAMLLGCGWDSSSPLADPLCGSGTIAIEAALFARDIAPGLATAAREPRDFAFTRWPGHDTTTWSTLIEDARDRILERCSHPITASDRAAAAIRAAQSNAARAGVENDVEIKVQPLSDIHAPASTGYVITNPPYGVRVGSGTDAVRVDRELRRIVHERFAGWTLVRLAPGLPRSGTRSSIAFSTRNGGIAVSCLVEPPLHEQTPTPGIPA